MKNEKVLEYLKNQSLEIDQQDALAIMTDKGYYYSVSELNKNRFVQMYKIKNSISNSIDQQKHLNIIEKIEHAPVHKIIIITYVLDDYSYQFYFDSNFIHFFGGIKNTSFNKEKVKFLIEDSQERGLQNSYKLITNK